MALAETLAQLQQAVAADSSGPPARPHDPLSGVRPEEPPWTPPPPKDTFTTYEELTLADGRVLRRYDTGSVRVENPTSGIIQEERADGSLLVSLPQGLVIYQEFRGEPLLVYDVDRGGLPEVARVVSLLLPGQKEHKYVFLFQDAEGSHLIELETLRYYRVRPHGPPNGR